MVQHLTMMVDWSSAVDGIRRQTVSRRAKCQTHGPAGPHSASVTVRHVRVWEGCEGSSLEVVMGLKRSSRFCAWYGTTNAMLTVDVSSSLWMTNRILSACGCEHTKKAEGTSKMAEERMNRGDEGRRASEQRPPARPLSKEVNDVLQHARRDRTICKRLSCQARETRNAREKTTGGLILDARPLCSTSGRDVGSCPVC